MNLNTHRSRVRTVLLCCLGFLGMALWIDPASATPSPNVAANLKTEVDVKPVKPAPRKRGQSMNFPWDGQLVRGKKLRESRYIRHMPDCTANGHFFGTTPLVQMIERASKRVAQRYPGAKLSVGELSSAKGGDIGGHNSHESGRDADIGFYIKRDGQPYNGAREFVPFDGMGRGIGVYNDLRFDDARNWELISRLVTDPDARVQYIFVARPIRARLLREAVRRKASATVIDRAETVLVQPARGNPHRSHFHVRVYCALSDRPMCRDVAPFWAWYPAPIPVPVRSVHEAAESTATAQVDL